MVSVEECIFFPRTKSSVCKLPLFSRCHYKDGFRSGRPRVLGQLG